MKNLKTGPQHAIIALFILCISTILGFIPILLLGILKLIPIPSIRNFCEKSIEYIAILWNDVNNFYIKRTYATKLEIYNDAKLDNNNSYIVIANHQSWLDIVIIQNLLNRKIPLLRYFMKDNLKWIPLLGFAWWSLGCPFMKRYSKAYLEKYPHKKGEDLKTTKKAVAALQKRPSAIMNFIEGTRFTENKKQLQQSPYKNLLQPKAGGVALVIAAMHKKIDSLLDITIIYPKQNTTLWQFLCKKINTIKVHVRELPIPKEFLTKDLTENQEILMKFRQWLNEKWQEKDIIINS